jgi:hypothetical protein
MVIKAMNLYSSQKFPEIALSNVVEPKLKV